MYISFSEEGPKNTDAVVKTVMDEAGKRGIKHVVVASNTGKTALKFRDSGLEIVCVTHVIGFDKPGSDEMGAKMRKTLADAGIKVYTGTHLFGGVGRAARLKHGGVYPDELAAETLRMFGQGVKVAVECSVMALDAGLVPYGKKIIAIGGTGSGADAAIVITPSHAKTIFASRIHEILCKPA